MFISEVQGNEELSALQEMSYLGIAQKVEGVRQDAEGGFLVKVDGERVGREGQRIFRIVRFERYESLVDCKSLRQRYWRADEKRICVYCTIHKIYFFAHRSFFCM